MWTVSVKAAQSELNESPPPPAVGTNKRTNERTYHQITFLNLYIDLLISMAGHYFSHLVFSIFCHVFSQLVFLHASLYVVPPSRFRPKPLFLLPEISSLSDFAQMWLRSCFEQWANHLLPRSVLFSRKVSTGFTCASFLMSYLFN